mmetsp:Transcript_81945/g.155622  ORF Transcript_81945/g.155622 Transcript_81945/m.155622 type:complete len:379 (-) Transcript_81945:121-1257(-)
MPVNPSTASTVAAAVGVGLYGLARWSFSQGDDASGSKLQTPVKKEERIPISRTVIGQTGCATVAGWFQVYSGGIAIDTVATRLQAGMSPSRALWGVEKADMLQVQKSMGMPAWQFRYHLLIRSNLFAGHFVTMLSRFPYLCLNFNSYALAERQLLKRNGGNMKRSKTLAEEFACVSVATLTSTAAISAAECPKILDQLKAAGQPGKVQERETVTGVIQKYGFQRLMQGYTACFCREFLFNTALLGSPAVASKIREHYVLPQLETSSFARILDGKELEAAALSLGLGMGFITNAPDQMKTNIQKGQFLNMRQALAWQMKQPSGVLGLFGRAAVWRSLFIAQAVLSINFARSRVENMIDSISFEERGLFAMFLGSAAATA